MAPPALPLLLSLVLLVRSALGAEALLDGNVYPLEFGDQKLEKVFQFTWTDPSATTSVLLTPGSNNSGSVNSLICYDENCEDEELNITGFQIYDIPFNESKMLNKTLYVKIKGTPSTKVQFTLMSSFVLTHKDVVTLDSSDGYDYEGNNYYRFFRVFLCDSETSLIRLDGSGMEVELYANRWNSDTAKQNGEAVGRPTDTSYDHMGNNNIIRLSKIFGDTAPSWVFIGMQFLNDFTGTEKLEITTTLEIPSDFDENNVAKKSVCIYEDCLTEVIFNANNSTEFSNEGKLQILLMPTENFNHGESSVYVLTSSTNNPPRVQDDRFYQRSAGNIMEITKQSYNKIIEEGGFIYTSVSTTQTYKYPEYEGEDVYGDVTITYLFDKTILRASGTSTSLTLQSSVDSDNKKTCPVVRSIFSAAGVSHPYLLTTAVENTLGIGSTSEGVQSHYYIEIKPVNQANSNLQAGLYIGNGMAVAPNTEEFLYQSSNKGGKVGIWIDLDSNNYYEDGAYILDIYNSSVDETSGEYNGPDTLDVKVTSIASWELNPGTQYGYEMTGSSVPVYFTLKTCDVSKGVSVYTELSYSVSNYEEVSLYASLTNPLPDESSEFSVSGYGTTSLLIDPESFNDIETIGNCYNVYVALKSIHKGQTIIIFTEGSSIDYHINDGQKVNVVVSKNDVKTTVNFHSDEIDSSQHVLVYITGNTSPWPSDVIVRGCVSTEILSSYEECQSNKFSINEWSLNDKVEISQSGDDNHPNYFIYLFGRYSSSSSEASSTVSLTVFAEDYDVIVDGDPVVNIVNYQTEPFLLDFVTSRENDYSIVTTLTSSIGVNEIVYNARICYDKPAYSLTEPPDIDASTNKRLCVSYVIRGSETNIYDLLGDISENDKTLSDDIDFITSSQKYLSYFPSRSLVGVEIRTELYEDKRVLSNVENTTLYGQYMEYNYFRLRIPGEESTNSKDNLAYKFTSNYPFSYCLSNVLHANPNSGKCLRELEEFMPNEENNSVLDIIYLNEYYEYYNAMTDVYVYFSYYFTQQPENNTSKMSMIFSNTVGHYLNMVNTDEQNIEKEAHIFSMDYFQYRTFITSDFDVSKPIRFLMTPYVSDTSKDNISDLYFTNQISVNVYDQNDYGLERPNLDNSVHHSAGIVLFDYYPNQDVVNSDGVPVITFVAALSNITVIVGSYRAALLGQASDSFTKSYSDITIMEKNKYYRYKYDPRGTEDDKKEQSKLFYYPSAKDDTMLRVFPCAGAPGIYMSYISSNPHWNDGVSLHSPTEQYGYKYGNSFYLMFNGFTNSEDYPVITVPTGMMFNFTVDHTAFVVDPSPYTDVRWDSESWIMSSDVPSATGGPSIGDKTLKVSKTKGLQINISFSEALSGYSKDPSITNTHIEYALYAIPAVSYENTAQYFDASPYTHCGLLYYGFPITADRKTGEVIWKRGNIDSGANNPNLDNTVDTLNSIMTLKSSYDPNEYVYPSNVVPVLNESLPNTFVVNVVAREVNDDNDNVIGYSVYNPLTLEIKGSFPVTEDGLFGWEIGIIVVAVIILVIIIIIFVLLCLKRKRKTMIYQNLDGHGNDSDEYGLNIELPDDDISISFSDSKYQDNERVINTSDQ